MSLSLPSIISVGRGFSLNLRDEQLLITDETSKETLIPLDKIQMILVTSESVIVGLPLLAELARRNLPIQFFKEGETGFADQADGE